jgi:hypothetical protein
MTATRFERALRDRRPTAVVVPMGLALGLVAGGVLIGGAFGGVVALAGVGVWWWTGRPVAPLALVLLVVTALATLIDAWPSDGSLRQSFASDRGTAAAAGLAAGVALLVALGQAARTERPATPTVAPPQGARQGGSDLRALVTTWWPHVAVVLVAVVLRALLAPGALPAGHAAVADSLRAGHGFSREVNGVVEATAAHPPVGVLVTAVFPAIGWVTGAVTALTVVAMMRLGRLVGGRRLALVAGTVAAVLPWVWAQPLPEALAGLSVVTGLGLAWPTRLTTGRAAAAGFVLGVGVLARPEVTLVLPVIALWVALERWPRLGSALTILVACGVTALPWWLHLHRTFETVVPATVRGPSLLDDLGGVGGLLVTAVACVVAAAEGWRRRDQLIGAWARWLPFLVFPVLAFVVIVVSGGDRSLTPALVPVVSLGAGGALLHTIDRRFAE